MAAVALLASILMVLPGSAGSAAGHGAKVTIVHGVPGLTVDICVDGTEAIEDSVFEDIFAEVPFGAGTYDLGVTVANTGCGAAVLTADGVVLSDGDNVSVVAHLTDGGAPTLSIFVNDDSAVDLGNGRLTVRHTAEAPAVDIWANGGPLFVDVSNPEERLAEVCAGTYEVAIAAHPSASAGEAVVGPIDLDVLAGGNRIVYAIGTLGVDFTLLVQDIAVDTVNPSEITPIYDIQGDGSSSPLAGCAVRTTGVVTGDFQHNGGLGGFFLQDATGDADPATSDGIFVAATDPFPVVSGAHIEVVGFVEERFGQTQITNVQEVLNSGVNGAIAPTEINPPFMDALEAVEGMLVVVGPTMHVTDTFNLHRFGNAWLTAGGVSNQPTDVFPTGTDADDLAAANMENSLLLDDGSTWSNPNPVPYAYGPAPGTLRLGDYVDDLTGNITYSFGQYGLQPTEDVHFSVGNPRPGGPPDVGGDITIAGFNVLNYWTTLGGRGADTNAQLAAQTNKLVAAIAEMDADVVALQEIENDPTHVPIQTLVAALNANHGSDVWSWIGELDYYNDYPIRNEIIYRNDRVAAYGDPMTIADPAFDDIPPGRSDSLGRPPVAQTFMYGLEKFTVMSNHFKSKGCSGSSGGDEDQGDGQSCFNATRVLQASVVLDFVDYIVSETGDPDVIVMGDLNAYMEEDPIHEMETELTNLLEEYSPGGWGYNFFASFAFPYVGRGNLDHAFATWDAQFKVTGASTWNINADEPRYLDWFDTSRLAPNGFRSSDHDPVLVGFAAPGADFGDIGDSVFLDDILFLAATGVTFGCNPPTNDLYCPERELTVGELAAMVRRGIDAPDSATDYYTDDDSSVFEGDINALADLGYTIPCGAGLICPDAKVTREVAAAMAVLAFGLPGTGTDYFTDDESSPHEDALNSARESGLLFGCNPPTNDNVCPTDILNRGMVAAVLHRAALLGYWGV